MQQCYKIMSPSIIQETPAAEKRKCRGFPDIEKHKNRRFYLSGEDLRFYKRGIINILLVSVAGFNPH